MEAFKDAYIVETVDLKKVYIMGKIHYPALRGVNMKVKRGEIMAIMGPSGSGKSTLLNLLGALDRPTEGKVCIDKVDIFTLPDNRLAELRNKKIGFVFQAYNLIPRITALRNVELPLIVRGIPAEERRKKAMKMLEAVGLGGMYDKRPTELSGGEQQRVAIARALVTNPSIVLGDEITGNLDSKTTMEIMKLVRELNMKLGTTFILVTHNWEVAKVADRIIHLRDGVVEREEPFRRGGES